MFGLFYKYFGDLGVCLGGKKFSQEISSIKEILNKNLTLKISKWTPKQSTINLSVFLRGYQLPVGVPKIIFFLLSLFQTD